MRIYICIALVCAIFFVFLVGKYVGNANCRTETVIKQQNVQSEIIKKIGDVNAETFSRGVGDIRRVLREKYTIAE